MKNTSKLGSIGEAHVVVDLLEKGLIPCKPLKEGLSYDLVCIKQNKYYKIQVKYALKIFHFKMRK